MLQIKKSIICLLLIVSLFCLYGCFMNADSLYSLPKRTDVYENLQQAVEEAMGDGGEYCAPVYGSNRQAVQQADLDGDGQDEYIVFVKCPGEKPLKVLIFQRQKLEFSLLYSLDGDGTAFDSVEYANINNDRGYELIVGRRVSEQVSHFMSVFSFKGSGYKELLTASYTDYVISDLDEDGASDILILRPDSGRRNAVAELYRWQKEELTAGLEISLSVPAENIKRIISGKLSSGSPAVFVAGTYDENSILTDVFAVSGGILRNISASETDGVSTQTIRNYYVYSGDIDSDGITEIPETMLLSEDSEDQYIILWKEMNPDGSRSEKLRTYHNYADGWYMILPTEWTENLIVTRKFSAKSTTYLFQTENSDGSTNELLKIYRFTGEDAAIKSEAMGRVPLCNTDTVFYSVLVNAAGPAAAYSVEELSQMFRLLNADIAFNDN